MNNIAVPLQNSGPTVAERSSNLPPLQGIYGGTFDPIHLGHLGTVSDVLNQTQLEVIRWIPSAIPPHRPTPGADADHRLAMVRIATESEPRFIVDDCELRRTTPSFTADTIRLLLSQSPERRYALILGMDALLGLPTWHQCEWLLDRVHIIVMQRPGWSAPHPLPKWWAKRQADQFDHLHQTNAGRIWAIKINPINISATQIRQRIQSGKDIQGLIPQGVLDYIRDHQLYEKQTS